MGDTIVNQATGKMASVLQAELAAQRDMGETQRDLNIMYAPTNDNNREAFGQWVVDVMWEAGKGHHNTASTLDLIRALKAVPRPASVMEINETPRDWGTKPVAVQQLPVAIASASLQRRA